MVQYRIVSIKNTEINSVLDYIGIIPNVIKILFQWNTVLTHAIEMPSLVFCNVHGIKGMQ